MQNIQPAQPTFAFKNLLHNKVTLLLIAFLVLIIGGAVWGISNFRETAEATKEPVEEVDLTFDPEGPYALLHPRRDGNALILNLKRTASYDEISYELAYNSEGIDRGVVGTIDTKDKKGEYEQEILFGTCSKNVCKYDQGVENGTLTLHIRKGNQAFRINTQWHIQKPDESLGRLTAGDDHFRYEIDAKREELSLISYIIINDLSGAPKLPSSKEVFGKVYAINVPLSKQLIKGTVTFELAENPPTGSKLARYDEGQNKWVEYETAFTNGKVTTEVETGGIFAVLAPE